MVSEGSATRAADFERNPLLWVTLNHFLTADLLRELFSTLVKGVSKGSLTVADILDEQLSEGPSVLRSWTVRPLLGAGGIAPYLQQLAQVLLWAGDETATWGREEPDADLRRWTRDLTAAQDLATVELGPSVPPPDRVPPDLRPLVAAMHTLNEQLRLPDQHLAVDAIVEAVRREVDAPLSNLVAKHLGDLCAGQDAWEPALQFYSAARGGSSKLTDPAWADFQASFDDIIVQSLAASCWALRGPDTAVVIFEEPFSDATLKSRPLLLLNAKHDELNARLADRKGFDFPGDDRAARREAPLLLRSQDLSRAWNSWTERKFESAYRGFWAALRRQIALGSVSDTRTTKIAYGRCLVDGLQAQLAQHHRPEMFAAAVRLMIESGHAEAAAQAGWTDALVKTYLTPTAVDAAIQHIHPERGEGIERLKVTIALFERWLQLLPPDAGELPNQMMAFLAYAARTNERSFNSALDIGGRSLKALKQVARTRPEHGRKVAADVASAVEAHLAGSDFLAISEALETLGEYFEAVEPVRLRNTLTALLDVMDKIGPGTGNWTVIRPALNLLVSEAAKAAVRDVPDLKRRMTATTVRFALAEGSETNRLLFLLRNLDAELLAEVDAERLSAAIDDVRLRANDVNNSSSINCIYALLAAPKLVGKNGIGDALSGLQSILRSVLGRRNQVSFPQAYHAVILLGGRGGDIARDLDQSEEVFRAEVRPLFNDLLAVWAVARNTPLVFANFQFPPATAPNAILVHNWTFGSLALARWLEQTEAMNEALDLAAEEPSLADGIAGGRAARVTAGDEDAVDADSLAKESRDAFYGALGTRIMNLSSLTPQARPARIRLLVNRCLELGPQGVDAGLFVAALDAGLASHLSTSDTSVADYRRRLENDRGLRLSLLPMFHALCAGEPDDN